MREVIDNSNFFAPYGMAMEGRNFVGGFYRFGFNGKEKEKEFTEGYLDFGARIYDSRAVQFLSIDPWYSKYPWQSTYCAMDNNPIMKTDPTGKGGEVSIYNRNTPNQHAEIKFNLHLYSDDPEGLRKSLQELYGTGSEGVTLRKDGKYAVDVPVEAGADFRLGTNYIPVTKATIIIDVVNREQANAAMGDPNTDASHNYFEVADRFSCVKDINGYVPPVDAAPNYPLLPLINEGYIRKGLLFDKETRNVIHFNNVIAEELWHTLSAVYKNPKTGRESYHSSNESGGDICASISNGFKNSIKGTDMTSVNNSTITERSKMKTEYNRSTTNGKMSKETQTIGATRHSSRR